MLDSDDANTIVANYGFEGTREIEYLRFIKDIVTQSFLPENSDVAETPQPTGFLTRKPFAVDEDADVAVPETRNKDRFVLSEEEGNGEDRGQEDGDSVGGGGGGGEAGGAAAATTVMRERTATPAPADIIAPLPDLSHLRGTSMRRRGMMAASRTSLTSTASSQRVREKAEALALKFGYDIPTKPKVSKRSRIAKKANSPRIQMPKYKPMYSPRVEANEMKHVAWDEEKRRFVKRR